MLALLGGERTLSLARRRRPGALGAKLGVLALVNFADLSRFPLPGIRVFYVPWMTVVYALGLAAAVGLASGLVPAWRSCGVSSLGGSSR